MSVSEFGVYDHVTALPSAVTAVRIGPRMVAILSMTMHPTSTYCNRLAKREEKQVVSERSPP
jgi:hypothetical protein